MSRFIQLHLLTSYPPANLNRDDLGSPKTAVMGGSTRLRISSQSLKRAWRTSSIFEESLKGHIGTRTKQVGKSAYKKLIDNGFKEKDAKKWIKEITDKFGKTANEPGDTEQLVHLSPEESSAIDNLTEKMIKRKSGPKKDELKLLKKDHTAADIALFGRMLANSPEYNTEAAVQVAHAFSVHSISIEDDFFSAVDDLNSKEEHSGSAHIGNSEFSAGLCYLYICIDTDLLLKNLSEQSDLKSKVLTALVESALKVSPTGKQNSFASRAYASYLLCEKGSQQPRSLSVAFLKPIEGRDVLKEAIETLKKTADSMDKAYGKCCEKKCEMNVSDPDNKTTINDVIKCMTTD